jgi:hypothetical protein
VLSVSFSAVLFAPAPISAAPAPPDTSELAPAENLNAPTVSARNHVRGRAALALQLVRVDPGLVRLVAADDRHRHLEHPGLLELRLELRRIDGDVRVELVAVVDQHPVILGVMPVYT